MVTILPTKTIAAKNEDALSYIRVRGLYYLAAVFVATIYTLTLYPTYHLGHVTWH